MRYDFGVVDLKLRRNLYVMVTGIVVCSLFVGGLTFWLNSGIGVGWHFATPVFTGAWGYVVLMCCVVGAVGVVWLGWYWLKLAGTIASIAQRITGSNSVGRIGKGKLSAINGLSELINEQLDSNADYIAELEKQIKDSQIQIQLTQRQKRNTDAIIYSIRDAVIVVDEFDRLLMANEAAGRLFNFNFKTAQHRPIDELIPIDADKNEFVDFLRQSRQSKSRATRREIKIVDRKEKLNAKERILDCIISCVYDESKQNCGVVAVLHDITHEKEVSQMKNDFVNHVSHELKTPLASITAYSEMLFDGEADDEQTRKEFYSVIQSQAKRLNRLIEDILNTSRIESGLIKVGKKPVSLAILIEEQLQMIKSYAEEKSIKIIRPECKDVIVFGQVYADKDMISQVIVNLLSNAVKYTRSGGSIKIETEICLNHESQDVARVSVTDTGVGIPENEIEHVFDKFYRVEANKAQAKGTGLGLNLVKQIVEKVHNGRVFVSSELGVGSTFGFELPLATQDVMSKA